MTTISQQVGQRLRNLRLSMGIKQEVMAENLKMTAPTYAKYEKGKSDPSIQFLHACANIFKIPVAQILDLDNADLWGDFSVNKTYAQQDTIYPQAKMLERCEQLIALQSEEIVRLKEEVARLKKVNALLRGGG